MAFNGTRHPGFQKGHKPFINKGRPKKEFSIGEILKRIGEEKVPPHLLAKLQSDWGPDFRPVSMRDAGMRVTYAKFVKGDKDAREFIANRTEGKVVDKVDFNDTTPREVIFKEVRLKDISVKEPVTVVRTIMREPKA